MTAAGPPLLLSDRQAARLLGCRRETVASLRRRGVLRAVPWFRGWRIPLAEVERLAAEGVTPAARRPRARRQGVKPPPRGVGDRIRALDVERL